MSIIFEIIDRTKRKLYLSKKQLKPIVSKHPEMQGKLGYIEATLIAPHKICDYSDIAKGVVYYYRYYKEISSKAKYLRVIVKYLNGEGFVITSYFVDKIE
ncbi:hypothetical protein HYT58_00765 [Candidatus Woesearchaeota archaeon]|nr:hypothetical protein [Candidatus Woesearchaeota archaeon]